MCHEDKEEHKILVQQDEIRVLVSYSVQATDTKKKIVKNKKTYIQRQKVAENIKNPENSPKRGG